MAADHGKRQCGAEKPERFSREARHHAKYAISLASSRSKAAVLEDRIRQHPSMWERRVRAMPDCAEKDMLIQFVDALLRSHEARA